VRSSSEPLQAGEKVKRRGGKNPRQRQADSGAAVDPLEMPREWAMKFAF